MSFAAGVYAGLIAGVVSTAAQLALWAAFTDALPSILFRDARLAAAIVLGADALGQPDDDVLVLVVATLVHFALSIAYGLGIGAVVRPLPQVAGLIAGAASGAALFAVNMYGMTALWPWFESTRDWITLAAHLVFGIAAAWSYQRLARRAQRGRAVTPRGRSPLP